MSVENQAGHTFLASLGKTRLRPGGIEGTEWLFSQTKLTKETLVLEVACNMATTSIEIAKKFNCKISAIDIDKKALSKAREKVARKNLNSQIKIFEGSASNLPFASETFDVVINEAMLTMYQHTVKAKLINEYYRVLKPGGCLLTHDLMYTNDGLTENERKELQKTVKLSVYPMTKLSWEKLLLDSQFSKVITHSGHMSLMSPRGLIKDEGIFRAIKIVFNGLKNYDNRIRFLSMFHFFKNYRHKLNYIACCSTK